MLIIKKIVSAIRKGKLKNRHLVFICAGCSVFLVVVFTYSFVRETLVQQAIEGSTNTLSFVMKFQDSLLTNADRTLGNLTSYPGLAECPEAFQSGKQLENFHTYQYLERVAQENAVYDHIAVYYPREGKVMATRWGVSLIEDFPKEIITRYAGNERRLTSFLLVDQEEDTNFSLVKNIPYGNTGEAKAIVCIDISSEYFKVLHQNMDYCGGDYFLTDQKHNLIYSSTPVPGDGVWDIVTQMQGDPQFASEGICYNITEIDGKSQLLTIVRSLNYDLIYCHYVPLQYITAEADRLLYIIITVLIVVVLLCIGATVIPVRSIYRAFANINDTIFSVPDYEHHVARSPEETARKISSIYADNKYLLSQNSSMELSVNKYLTYQKNQFLFDFLQNVIPADELNDGLARYEIAFNTTGLFCTVICSVDEQETYSQQYSVEQRGNYMSRLKKLGELELFAAFPHGQCVQLEDTEVCFILNGNQADCSPELMLEQILCAARTVHEKLCEESGVSLTISISEIEEDIENVPACYKQSAQVRDGRWLFGFGKVMDYNAVGDSSKPLSYPYDVEIKLLDALKANNENLATNYLEEFDSIIVNSSCLGIRFAQHCLLRLLSSTYRCLYEYHSACLSVLPNERELYIDLLNEVTAQRMYLRICDIYGEIFNVLGQRVSNGRTHTVQQIKAYIGKHYMDGITLEGTGEEFHLSGSHLRRIFKEETGMSIKDYIDHVRMQQAEKLLVSTNESVREIATSSGFVSQQTFIRVFKKTFGVTPGEYRK